MPVLVALLLQETTATDIAAAVVFAAASATDALDGHLARRREEESDFGRMLDPLADKLLVTAALVTLAALGRLWVWAAALIIARELLVTLARTGAAQRGVVAPAQPMGKAKTALQTVTILALIVAGSPVWVDVLVVLAVVLTLWSGVDFALGLRARMRTGGVASRPAGHTPGP